MDGIIIIDKEPGFTSHDVVAKLRGICGQKKIGHTGTLDPAATGVLPVCLGSGTRLCDMLTDTDKEYVAELLLGVETDTQDTTGRVLATREVNVSREELRAAVFSFAGDYGQVPPMYSALKVNGKKLYELAREGKEVERKARQVKIHEIEILDCSLPVVKLRVACSKGTYIRTLCADIGARLGCGGTMQSLRRTAAGRFRLEDAVTLERVQEKKDQGRLKELILSVDLVFENCPSLHVRGEGINRLNNGNSILPEQTAEGTVHKPGEWVRFYGSDYGFAGIYAYDAGRKCYLPVKMFPGGRG
ncbi:tRNA pseudouridine synthase B [Lachnospiraceae bacterium]|jgi:tRNA pseudouridine55 synthase|nr:tRNA pseudouridine(55) synthase TruB [Lachnospiraceae bacterium]GFI64444.1 tRNA pseudouridine synthase B [Lachnospiraceae bacterium]